MKTSPKSSFSSGVFKGIIKGITIHGLTEDRAIVTLPVHSRHIILTGFMGTGKTAVGQALAERLGRRFLDTDRLVEEGAGLSIPHLFDRFGEEWFREREAEAVASLKDHPPGTVVAATGGGAVLREENRRIFRECGVVVLLTASLEAILRRVQRQGGRPLLRAAQVRERVLFLCREREPYYRECDLAVDTTGRTPARVAAEVVRRLGY